MTANIFDYNSTAYNDLLKTYCENPKSIKLVVLAGTFKDHRKHCINQFISETIGKPVFVDLSEYITQFEQETYHNLDQLFSELSSVSSLVIFKNAEELGGVYTGHTYSVVKYASPQEKYFLKKLKELHCPALVEFINEDHLDRTIARNADAVIRFKVPSSTIEKIFWAITQFKVNGSSLPSRRPV